MSETVKIRQKGQWSWIKDSNQLTLTDSKLLRSLNYHKIVKRNLSNHHFKKFKLDRTLRNEMWPSVRWWDWPGHSRPRIEQFKVKRFLRFVQLLSTLHVLFGLILTLLDSMKSVLITVQIQNSKTDKSEDQGDDSLGILESRTWTQWS